MTAKVTIIAQTRIGFLSGLRRFAGGEEAEDAYDVQREEAAARATVALTRAKELCGILGPLVGSLMYGVGLCWQQDLEFHYQQKELGGDMDDEQMVQQLKDAGACSELPPLALAEVVLFFGSLLLGSSPGRSALQSAERTGNCMYKSDAN